MQMVEKKQKRYFLFKIYKILYKITLNNQLKNMRKNNFKFCASFQCF